MQLTDKGRSQDFNSHITLLLLLKQETGNIFFTYILCGAFPTHKTHRNYHMPDLATAALPSTSLLSCTILFTKRTKNASKTFFQAITMKSDQ